MASRRSGLRLFSLTAVWVCLNGVACTGKIESPAERPSGGKASGGGAGGGTGQPGDPPRDPADPRDPAAPPAPVPGKPALGEAALRRLTSEQYRNALVDLLGLSAAEAAPLQLAEDARLSGLLSIGAAVTSVSGRATELFEQAADQVGARLFADSARRAALLGCDPAAGTCLETFLARFGRRAFRRPLAAEELERYLAVARTGATKAGDPWAGARTAVVALLQSPHFLYRVELGQAEPGDPTRLRLGAFEVASRLAFFVTNRPPDDQLLDAAQQDRLGDEQLAEHARRLLASPHAVAAVESFYDDYLDLGSLATLAKDAAAFPMFTDAIKADLRAETVRTLRTLTFDEERDFRTVFQDRTTFLTPALARFYGLPAPAGGATARAETAAERAGLLMQASLLALHAHDSHTSPSRRGKFVRETLLCQTIPDPPPNIETNLPPASGALDTTRKRVEAHVANPACSGCHALMDPIGLALENFDAVGRYRTTEGGAPIDAHGALDGKDFTGPLGLAEAVAAHPEVPACFAATILRQASGGLLVGEKELVADLGRRFEEGRFNVRALLLAVVSHPAFRFVRPSQGG
jgi:hypothetical protein